MKKILFGVMGAALFSSCSQVAGWFGNNSDSTKIVKSDSSSYAAYARDESINSSNAYSDLFLDSTRVENFIQNEKLNDSDATAMRNFYRARNYEYAWFSSYGPTEQARGLWSLYSGEKDTASKTSKDPATGLKQQMDSLLQNDSVAVNKNDSSFTQTELKLTQQLIRYASENNGSINRNNLYYLVPAKKVDAMEYADSILNKQKDSSLYANNKSYSLLKAQLANYYKVAKNGGWTALNSGQLKKGAKSPAVTALKKRLQATGEYTTSDTSNVFNDSLETAVQSFQQRNGLKATGVVNDSTISVLNIPAEQRVQQIIVNMDRLMWMKPQSDSNSIQVNIPSLMLYAYEGTKKTMEMPVIVGKEGNSTVMFTSNIDRIVFNPTWHIPQSIVRDEILPKMKSDPSYLKRKNIEVVKQNDSLPVLQQLPGKDNPLGKVKFLFPNSDDIYLHDTPDKTLFAKKDRALSHGCIRVADASKLAAYLLRDQSDWNAPKIKAAMNGGKEQTVNLKDPEPVAITYLTAWVDENGRMNFREDIYGHDREAMQKLFVSKS